MSSGGFGRLPSHREVDSLRLQLESAVEPLLGAVDMVASIDIPDWAERDTLFVALRPAGDGFGFRGDVICTSNGAEYPVEVYRDMVREFTVEHSTARHAARRMESPRISCSASEKAAISIAAGPCRASSLTAML